MHLLADYLIECTMNQIPTEIMASSLDIYIYLIWEHMDESIFRKIIGTLIETSMDLSGAAEPLYLYKNIVAVRVKKIREPSGTSPLTNTWGVTFMTAIYNYLNMV